MSKTEGRRVSFPASFWIYTFKVVKRCFEDICFFLNRCFIDDSFLPYEIIQWIQPRIISLQIQSIQIDVMARHIHGGVPQQSLQLDHPAARENEVFGKSMSEQMHTCFCNASWNVIPPYSPLKRPDIQAFSLIGREQIIVLCPFPCFQVIQQNIL